MSNRTPTSATIELDLRVDELRRVLSEHPSVRWEPASPILPEEARDRVVIDAGPVSDEATGERARFYLRPRGAGRVGEIWVELAVEATERGSRVAVTLMRKNPKSADTDRKLGWLALAIGAGGLLLYAIDFAFGLHLGLGFPYRFVIASAGAWVVLRVVNRPTQRALESYGSEVWGLLGQLFAPHMLGESADDPFRHRALPAGETRRDREPHE